MKTLPDAPLLLGIDIGTSGCKAALFHPDGRVEASATTAYSVLYPKPGWAEQDPEVWWRAVCSALKSMFAVQPGLAARVAGVGIDGQSWSAIPVDGEGRVLHNTPIWMDTRAGAECEALAASIGEKAIFALCGNPLKPAYTLPKILWYKNNVPEVYKAAKAILQSNSFIAYRLTGALSQDISQGYGLHCFNTHTGTWDNDMCREMGISPALLPAVSASHDIVGTVTAEAAAQSGIPAGTPVVAGGLDAACGTLGAGVTRPGQTQEQGGQAGGMSICTDEYRADERLILGFHVVPGRWLLQGGTVGGGGILNWFEAQLGAAERALAAEKHGSVFAEIDKAAAAIPPGSEGLMMLPYMAGERSPIWDTNAKGVYYGLDYSKTRAHMARASMEAVAYSLRHNLEVAAAAGAGVERLHAMGGAANSKLWTQIKSDITGLPIDVPSSDTATTLGAAMLAGVAVGVWADFDAAVAQTVRITRSHTPKAANKKVYDEGYATYRALYEALQPLMQKGRQQ